MVTIGSFYDSYQRRMAAVGKVADKIEQNILGLSTEAKQAAKSYLDFHAASKTLGEAFLSVIFGFLGDPRNDPSVQDLPTVLKAVSTNLSINMHSGSDKLSELIKSHSSGDYGSIFTEAYRSDQPVPEFTEHARNRLREISAKLAAAV